MKFDGKIALALIGALMTAAVSVTTAVWAAGHRDAAISDQEKRISKLETDSDKISGLDVRLARIEEQIKFMNETLKTALGGRR